MLLVVMLLGMATALLVYGMVDTNTLAARRDKDTAAAFADVKRALIGWSASRTPPTGGADARPGELPCPDMNNDGFEDGNCAAGAIGRVPWKTLGIAKPKDGWGETLWYAIAGPFRIWNVNNNPINSDTKGNITVNNGEFDVINGVYNMTSTITTEAVAVIFSPGAVLGAQNRSCPVPDCDNYVCPPPASSTPICNPVNYLETAAGVNNSTTNGPFISAPTSYTPSPGFNDKVMVITTADLIPVVEIRVARELLALLKDYSTRPGKSCLNNCYTAADKDFTNEEDDNAFWGWLPLCDADPDNWGELGIILPAWLTNNDWWKVIYYAVAPDKTENPGGGTLTVDGVPGTHVVLITPGPAPVGVTRPSLTILRTPTTPPQCVLEAPLNQSQAEAYWQQYLSPNDPLNYNTPFDNTYATPSSTAYARNRLYTIP